MSRILIVRTCAIGDFVLNLPALIALQKANAGARFTLVGNPSTLELARDFIDIEEIGSIDSERWRRLFYEPLPGLSFDRAIVWMKDPVVAENLQRSRIVDVLRADPFPVSGHAAEHLLKTVGLPAPELPDRWKPESDRVILQPGSGSPRKCWDGFRELASQFENVAFLLGPAEADYDTGGYPRIENLPLPEVERLLCASGRYIGNDSGITHLAAYLGVPTTAIFVSTDPAMWSPLGRRVNVVSRDIF